MVDPDGEMLTEHRGHLLAALVGDVASFWAADARADPGAGGVADFPFMVSAAHAPAQPARRGLSCSRSDRVHRHGSFTSRRGELVGAARHGGVLTDGPALVATTAVRRIVE